ncbi:hypothetical protein [Aquimarina sp. 2201CG14-23]|uniref:hypothetical protein n=1 Tax=Aquimarina mycalae TaxID=3040073 RepID=UPI0024781472|nr:hypothetical protein [Aquimarina sp. 2201CG14-23]MDH7447186.1 hypothetical protein [Aquimarina sp. 2201CG14-23]
MRNSIIIIIFLHVVVLSAQSNSEVYLFDIIEKEGSLTLSNQRNISNNEGYDNQPSFYNDNIVLFSSTRNKQTDIAIYNIRDAKVDWISDTKQGGEYSPTKLQIKKQYLLSDWILMANSYCINMIIKRVILKFLLRTL